MKKANDLQLRNQLKNNPSEELLTYFSKIDKNYIFTYGTLKQSHVNHKLLKDCIFIGQGMMKNKTMLNIGRYPAIVEGNHDVKGEVYQIHPDLISALDEYEGEGYLYKRKLGVVYLLDIPYVVSYYEWIDQVMNYPMIEDGIWFNDDPSQYVYYASYGSNLLEARFMKYIKRTSSKQIWLDTKILELPYNMYYANDSRKWNGGVAFLDTTKNGKAISKAYLIHKSQLQEIHEMEGNVDGWYDCLYHLGKLNGFDVYTITNQGKLMEHSASNDYLEVIAYGMNQFLDTNKISEYLHHDIHSLNLEENHILEILETK